MEFTLRFNFSIYMLHYNFNNNIILILNHNGVDMQHHGVDMKYHMKYRLHFIDVLIKWNINTSMKCKRSNDPMTYINYSIKWFLIFQLNECSSMIIFDWMFINDENMNFCGSHVVNEHRSIMSKNSVLGISAIKSYWRSFATTTS